MLRSNKSAPGLHGIFKRYLALSLKMMRTMNYVPTGFIINFSLSSILFTFLSLPPFLCPHLHLSYFFESAKLIRTELAGLILN